MEAECKVCTWKWKAERKLPYSKQMVLWRIHAMEHYEKTKHKRIDWKK